jgi:hypothetical protein
MNQNVHENYRTCNHYQWTCNLLMQKLVKLVNTLPEKPFQN